MFQANFGCQFHVEHFLIMPHRFHQPTHRGHQQPELEPWEFISLLIMASRASGTKALLLGFFLQAAVSCIRFEHFQRSTLVTNHGHWLEFKGARPPYNWAMPDLQHGAFSLLRIIREFCDQAVAS